SMTSTLSSPPLSCLTLSSSFLYTDTPPTQTYTLSLHDALPISEATSITNAIIPIILMPSTIILSPSLNETTRNKNISTRPVNARSEEHTSELQSRFDLVCRLLLEKKKEKTTINYTNKSIIQTIK